MDQSAYQQHHQGQQPQYQQAQYQQQPYQQAQSPPPPQYPAQGQHMDPNLQQQQQQMQYQPQQQMQSTMAAQRSPQDQEWTASFCNCSPCGSCLLSCCLPCILLGKTSERMADPSLKNYDVFNTDCLIMLGLSCVGVPWIYATIKRMEIRERFGIKGSGFGDCCAAYWCQCCVIIQNDNEVRARLGDPSNGPVAQGYQANPGMVVPTSAPAAPAPTGKH